MPKSAWSRPARWSRRSVICCYGINPRKEYNMAKDSPVTSISYLPQGMPLPTPMPDGLDAAFWEGTKNHRLLVQRCQTCGTFQFGPEWICHHCRSGELDWHECS